MCEGTLKLSWGLGDLGGGAAGKTFDMARAFGYAEHSLECSLLRVSPQSKRFQGFSGRYPLEVSSGGRAATRYTSQYSGRRLCLNPATIL
jgi:hypothetical protein